MRNESISEDAHVFIEHLKAYVGLDDEDAALLRALGPILAPEYEGVVSSFYEATMRSEGASAVFVDDAQVARHKDFLRDWLAGVFSGVYDAAYAAKRARIGRTHVRIGLAQRYMFAGMSVVRTALTDAMGRRLPQAGFSPARRAAARRAVGRILDLELAIMVETYAEDHLRRMRVSERFATLGQTAATVGHELRNPFAVMGTSLHLLRRRVGDDPKAARHAERIGIQLETCREIVDDLLGLARDAAPERKLVAPAKIVDEAINLLPKRDVPIEVRAIANLPEVNVDPGQVRQLLVNLLSNAVEATRGHGEKVMLRVAVEQGSLVIRVDDEGPGISAEARQRIFEPLFTTRSKGLGLGLALCQRIAEKHGGSISVSNRTEGGARFEVVLPG